MFGGNTLKPRHSKLSSNPSSFLPLPATVGSQIKTQLKHKNVVVVIVFIVFVFYVFISPLFHFITGSFGSKPTVRKYPRGHVSTSHHMIEVNSRYIYPPIEHAPYLKELTIYNLVQESKVRDSNFPEIEKTLVQSLNIYDNPDPRAQAIKEDEQNKLLDLMRAKNAFKNNDKKVFKPKKLSSGSYPEVIVVTAVDFEKYSVEALTMIVQNRVDYAHNQNYGIYVRWAQEFLPHLNSMHALENLEKRKWIRIFCIRAAMFAFPEAKWFWYLEEDAIIMKHLINIKDYILNPAALNPIMLREQLIIPPQGTIKTYKNSKAENIRIILTQSESKLETSSFMVKNDDVGRSIIDQWSDPLYLNYPNFPYGPDSALTHILQWHPFILSKTSIIPARTIAAQHTDVELPPPTNGKGGDHIHYYNGDFVAHWSDCKGLACEANVEHYFNLRKTGA